MLLQQKNKNLNFFTDFNTKTNHGITRLSWSNHIYTEQVVLSQTSYEVKPKEYVQSQYTHVYTYKSMWIRVHCTSHGVYETYTKKNQLSLSLYIHILQKYDRDETVSIRAETA